MTRLVLFHPMDPRGAKLGGIETHVRLVLARHPPSVSVLLVGVDEIGDCDPGRIMALTFDGRQLDFLPVLRVDPLGVNTAARRITQSTTLRFLLASLRHLSRVRRAIRGEKASCEIERFEFAVLPVLLRRPAVLLVHNEGTREDKMDSLLKRYWALHRLNERVALELADRVFAVNGSIKSRIERLAERLAGKTEVLSVSVDTQRFRPSPFPSGATTFRICFAGRLDAFKDPLLMFASLARCAERLAETPIGRFDRLAFDYVGASDPAQVAEFARIAPLTTRHGPKSAQEVAALMSASHAGIITSFFEGMPCYLLEMLASGRPVAAIALPQFTPLIEAGSSGRLVVRAADAEATAAAMTDALLSLVVAVAGGQLDPVAIARRAQPYSVDRQMGRLFAVHEALAGRLGQPSVSTSAA